MSMLDIANILLGTASGAMQFGMGMEQQKEWERRTDEALRKWRDLESTLMEGGDGFGGVLDVMNTFAPQYSGFAQDVKDNVGGLWDNIGTGYQDLYNSLTGFVDERGKEQQQGYNALTDRMTGQFDTLAADLTGRAADRTAQAMGYVDKMGQQQRKDILQQSDEQRARTQSDLIASGMGGSTLGAVMDRGVTRDTTDALGRLNESLLANKLDTFGSFSGNELDTQRWLGGAGLDLQRMLGTDTLGAAERSTALQTDVGSTIGQNKLSTMTGLGQYNTGAQMDAGMFALGGLQGLATMPLDTQKYLTSGYVGSSLDFGLPPEVMNPFSYIQQSLQPMYQRQIAAASRPKSGGGGFSGSVGLGPTGPTMGLGF